MKSPFTGFENATISFEVSNGNYTTNSVGNRIASTKKLEIKALLKQSENKGSISRYANEIQEYGGVDAQALLMEGYLVDPMVYPDEVEFGMEADCEIKAAVSVYGAKILKGKVKLLVPLQSPYVVGVGVPFVTPIIAVFRRN